MLKQLSPLAIAILTGCAATGSHDQAQYEISEAQLQAARQIIERPAPIQSPPSTAEFLSAESSEIRQAILDYQRTGNAPIVKDGQYMIFPHGQHQPIIYCGKALHACDIELQEGEKVWNVHIGDKVRWMEPAAAFSGPADNLTPHVIVKAMPMLENMNKTMSTNLSIFTDRRTYHLGLIYDPKKTYARNVKFYYPEDSVATWNKAQAAARQDRQSIVASDCAIDSVSFDYAIHGDAPWKPLRAFDCNGHVYIHMPDSMRYTEAPALFVVRNGENALVNYRVRPGENTYYVVDKLFEQAAMVVGVGRDQERVTISRVDKIRSTPRAKSVAFADK